MVQFRATPHALVRLKRHSTKVSSLTSLLHLAFCHPHGGCVQEVCETAGAKNGHAPKSDWQTVIHLCRLLSCWSPSPT
jgi:hypothetical protein